MIDTSKNILENIPNMKKGLLIILSGPSGVGKGTVREYIFSNSNLPFVYSVSMTTRKPRINEVDGKDYYFVSQEEFKEISTTIISLNMLLLSVTHMARLGTRLKL